MRLSADRCARVPKIMIYYKTMRFYAVSGHCMPFYVPKSTAASSALLTSSRAWT